MRAYKASHTQKVQPAFRKDLAKWRVHVAASFLLCTSHVKAGAPLGIIVQCFVSCARLAHRRFVLLLSVAFWIVSNFGGMCGCHPHCSSAMSLKFS